MKGALKYLILYILLMIVGFCIVTGIFKIATMCIPGYTLDLPKDLFDDLTLAFASQLLPMYVFWKRKYANYSFKFNYRFGDNFSTKKLFFWAAIASVACLLFDFILLISFPIIEEWNAMLFGDFSDDSKMTVLDLVSGCLLAPLVEEAVFRGAIERRLLEKDWNPWFAIVISALIFAIMHFNLFTLFSFFGILVGWVYYRTRSIWPGIVIHAVYNTIAFGSHFVVERLPDGTVDEDSVSLSLGVSVPLLFVGIVILFFCMRQIALLTKDRTPVPVTSDSQPELLSPLQSHDSKNVNQ